MILIRDYKPEDYNFIITTWVKSQYSDGPGAKEHYKIFHKGIVDHFQSNLDKEELKIYIAHTKDDEDFILGYAVFGTDYTLHYCFTKGAFKKMGIAKTLLGHFYKNKKQITVSHLSKDSKYIAKMYELEYNRFTFYKAG